MKCSSHPHRFPIPNLCVILLVTLLATISSGVSAQECSAGFHRKAGVCQPCPPGTYQELGGQNICEKCSAGTFNPFPEGNQEDNCVKCPPGMFSRKGAVSCKKCPPGLNSISGAPRCTKCKPGTGRTDFDEEYCYRCESGYFNDGSSLLCQKCPGGTFTNAKATGCSKCPKGTFRDVRLISFFPVTRCFKCQEGSYADEEGTEQCKLCPPGTSSSKGASKCTSCAAGYYRLSPRHKTCNKCPEGTTSLGKRPAGCMRPKKGCPQNTFEVDGECRACSPGERLSARTTTCVPCGEDEVSDGGDVQECVKCRSDQYPAPARTVFENSACYCKPGFQDDKHGNCVKCHPGSWWNDSPAGAQWTSLRRDYSNNFRQGACGPCSPMTYSDESGSIECKRCAIGLVSGTGETKCKQCPNGHLPNVVLPDDEDSSSSRFSEARCYSVKHNCGFGEVRTRNRGCKRSFCPAGAVKGRYECINCGKAEFLNEKRRECMKCPKGTGNDGRHVKTTCQKCSGKGKLAPGCLCPSSRVMLDGVCTECRTGLVAFRGECRPRICDKGMVPDAKGKCRKCGPTSIRKNVNDTVCTPCGKGLMAGHDLFGASNDRCVPM